MTVEFKSQKVNRLPVSEAAPRTPSLEDIFDIDPLQQGHAMLAANKKRKKKQKRAGSYLYGANILILHIISIMVRWDYLGFRFSVV